MQRYNPAVIEPKWQKIWQQTRLYEATEDNSRQKIYATPMLPYPSGAGLHVGHVRNYSIADAIARWHRQRGHNVMSNIGWDSFGLPAENYAVQTGTPPWVTTQNNIKQFKKQLMRLGISYDWSREIDTSDPRYYKWTQWIFTQLFSHNLAYQAESWQWWCPDCKTVLANEQVINGCCWRHEETLVVKKRLKQWFFKITDYAEDLLAGIEDLDWPEHIKTMQRNWIGKSKGAELTFKLNNRDEEITVFTTRPDTIYGATFLVIAPEHPLVESLTNQEHAAKVEEYVSEALKHSDVERLAEERPKSGVFTGSYALNPANDEPVPIWVADYVLMGYGTGAIMAVPAHDERDWAFAKKYGLPILHVYTQDDADESSFYTGEGIMKSSDKYDGLTTADARERIVTDLAKRGLAKDKVQYKLRDWLISRQRYWGAPIPIIHCPQCGAVAVPETDLPVELPQVKDFAPTGKSTSVLALVEDWVNVDCPNCHGPAKRETDTMDGYACSSWYMLRYTDPGNDDQAWAPAKANYWLPIDFYFGADHAVSHLLYFRFWQRFFVDRGWVDKTAVEPVKRLVYNGYINAADGSKMSKKKGNVVDPLEVIDSGYGADALRLFELFIGPYDQDVSWNPSGVPGTYRFLVRVWKLVDQFLTAAESPGADANTQAERETQLLSALHRCIKKVTQDLEHYGFNTAVASLMELVNTLNKLLSELPMDAHAATWREVLETLVALLAPFAPFMTEELWSALGKEGSVHVGTWPKWNDNLLVEELQTIVVQVNGKVRANLSVAAGTAMDEVVKQAKLEPNVKKYLAGTPKKVVTVKGKLVNFVV